MNNRFSMILLRLALATNVVSSFSCVRFISIPGIASRYGPIPVAILKCSYNSKGSSFRRSWFVSWFVSWFDQALATLHGKTLRVFQSLGPVLKPHYDNNVLLSVKIVLKNGFFYCLIIQVCI